MAVAPGIPDLEAQEKRDRVAPGLYQRLHDDGLLSMAEGFMVQRPEHLWAAVRGEWGNPVLMVCDRFRLPELQEEAGGWARIESRVTRWSDASFDIRALRKGIKDGPLVVSEDSRALMIASLSVAQVKNDDAGSFRLVKRDSNNTARDDAARAGSGQR